MSFFRFVKLVLQHYLLVMFVPFFMVALVYYWTEGEEKTYSSTTSIYTGIASGFNVDMRQGVGDRFMIQSVFENILTIMKSKSVKEEVAIKLIAQHLIQEDSIIDYRICSSVSIKELHNLIPEKVRKQLTVKNDVQKTFDNTYAYLKKDHKNVIYKIVYSKRKIPHYSILALNDLSFKRIKTSDLVQIQFSCNDAGITTNTLMFFSESFIKKYRYVKVSETNDIVSYFQLQLKKAQATLDDLEAQLLAYRTSNNILDYTEQVRAIAQRRQEMEGEIYKERMNLSSAQYTSSYSEKQLEMHFNVLEKNTEIMAKRNILEELASKIAMTQVFDTPNSKDSIYLLQNKLKTLRAEMELDLDAIFAINYSTSGVKTSEFLKKWFDNIINEGESKARLKVYAARQNNFKELYQNMAPIGSNLTKIEREVAVAEGAYLRILEALNLAKMRQQNIALSTKLKVVDAPLYPTDANPSKRKLLIIITFLVGALLIVSLLVILEFLNQSIRQPLRLIEATGLTLASAFPLFPSKFGKVHYHSLRFSLSQRLVEQLEQRLEVHGVSEKKPKYIIVASMQETEGKTLVAAELAQSLLKMGKVVQLSRPEKEKEWESPLPSDNQSDSVQLDYYNADQFLLKAGSIDAIVQANKSSDYVIIELPYLQSYCTPHAVLKDVDCCLLVARANRSWTIADTQSLENLKTITGKDPMVFLNGVKLQFLEEIVGQIPKTRNKIRKWFRQLIRLEFKK
jgi:succinoglycan biosynthesis transport protein ExoP